MTLKLQLVHLAWEGVAGSSGFDILLNGVKVSNAGPKARTTKILIPEGAEHRVTIKAQPSGLLQEAKFQWSSVGAAPPPPPPPPTPTSRYTDIDFAAGKYAGEGIESVFVAYQSDSRVSDWGGLEPVDYDARGCTLDPNTRVHLAPLFGRSQASWQELRSTDGPWASTVPNLAKASLNISKAATFGPNGYTPGAIRWFAWDYLLPLNVDGASFEFVNTWHVLADIHSNGGDADPGLVEVTTGNPRWVNFGSTPDTQSVPYLEAKLLQLTNADGSRVTSSYNVWHEVVMGIRFAADGTGWVEVWHDGVQKLARTNRATIHSSESGPYAQLQNYTSYPTSFVGGKTRSAIVYGGFRAGLARSDVQTR